MQDLQMLQDAARQDKGGCKYPTPPCVLAKILPETTVRAWFRQIENASGPKPCGGNYSSQCLETTVFSFSNFRTSCIYFFFFDKATLK